ncbi:MAG: LysM peptidoglycan-binding domain-containing protein [Chloroflexota bacterium]
MENQAEGEAGAIPTTRDSNGGSGGGSLDWPVYGRLGGVDDDPLAAAEAEALAEATRTAAWPEPALAPPAPRDESFADLVAPRAYEPRTPEPLGLASPIPATCPFLRSEGPDGRLGRPIEGVDPANRCAAFGDPRAPSPRQQSNACLVISHVDCQRYRRGALAVRSSRRTSRRVTSATLAAVLVLVASASASLAFVVVRGGLTLPTASPAPSFAQATPGSSAVAVVVPTAAVTPRPTRTPDATATPEPTPTTTPTATPTPTPTPSPTPTPTPTPSTDPSATPAASSDRYQLLEPCPAAPDCYIYVVRRGDNLSSIARYFGVPLATVRELNPWTATRGLNPGDQLILPPPTR